MQTNFGGFALSLQICQIKLLGFWKATSTYKINSKVFHYFKIYLTERNSFIQT